MSGHHFVSYYNCGVHVAAQCRCPGPKTKEVTNTMCPVCVGAQIASARADDGIAALRKRVEELEANNDAAQVSVGAFEDIKARAKKAERRVEELEQERLLRDAEMAEEGIAIGKQRAYDAARVQIDEARTKQRQAEARAVKLQADLDAALDWIENECPPPQGDFPADQPILALLEKRK